MSHLFQAQDMDGYNFEIEFDGAEGIGFWIGDPDDYPRRLSVDDSARLVEWFHENWKVSE